MVLMLNDNMGPAEAETVWSRQPGQPKIESSINFKVAGLRNERQAAFRLIYRAYSAAGMIPLNPHCMRVTRFHLQQTTSIFIAALNQKVISTVSLVGDGRLGLPAEAVHRPEVDELRSRGMALAEVSCLADSTPTGFSNFAVVMRLMRLMAQSARHNGVEGLLISVRPKHARFYHRYMGFEQMGHERPYPSVNGVRGVLCCLDFARVDRERPASYEFFFGEEIPERQLRTRPMPAEDVAFFAPVVFKPGRPMRAPLVRLPSNEPSARRLTAEAAPADRFSAMLV